MKLHGSRLRAGGTMLAAALLAVAILALPAIGKGGENSGNGPRAAGTIESFDNESGELTIALGEGGTISALVVRRTHIRCGRDDHGAKHQRRARRGADDPATHDAGDNNGGAEGGNNGRRGHCNVDDLVPGATVMKAEIVLTHGKAIYKKVGLLPTAATS